MGQTPAEKQGRQGWRDSSSCSAHPAGVPRGLPSRGLPPTRALGEHSAPRHRHVATQRRLLTTVLPVGLSSVELGQDHRVWCLPSVPEPPGQRDRPGYGKGPLSPWAPHGQTKMQAALVLRARAAGQMGRGAAVPAEPQPPTAAGGQAWAPGRTGGPRGACGQRRSHLRLPHLSRASPHPLAGPVWYQAPRCTHPQAPSRPPSGPQGPERAEGSHPPVMITCRGQSCAGSGPCEEGRAGAQLARPRDRPGCRGSLQPELGAGLRGGVARASTLLPPAQVPASLPAQPRMREECTLGRSRPFFHSAWKLG